MSWSVGCWGFFAGFLFWKGRIFPFPSTAVPEAMCVLPGLHALPFMSQVWQWGATQTSWLELYKEQGEPLQSKAADTLGLPEASSQCQQRNHRWTCCITALLVGWLMYPLWQSIPSAQQWAGRAGRRAGYGNCHKLNLPLSLSSNLQNKSLVAIWDRDKSVWKHVLLF